MGYVTISHETDLKTGLQWAQGYLFSLSTKFKPALAPTQALIQLILGGGMCNGQSVMLTTPFHLVMRLYFHTTIRLPTA
jgi:hypothetical protein